MVDMQRKYRDYLAAFRYRPTAQARKAVERELGELLRGLPAVTGQAGAVPLESLKAELAAREAAATKGIGRCYSRHLRELSKANLRASHAYQIMFSHSMLVDALHAFAFDAALQDLPGLIRLRAAEGRKELEARRAQLTKKLASRDQGASGDDAPAPEGAASQEERDYYARLQQALEAEIAQSKAAVRRLEAHVPLWEGYRVRRKSILREIVWFARGGYGRAEMSFSSDLDTGCCVEMRKLKPGEVEIYQELVMRTESLLKGGGVKTVHQYFETDEDLGRFTEPATIHTIPAILEARPILGNPAVLDTLKARFRAVLPYEVFLRQKVGEYEQQARPGLTEMDVKEDRGGLRTIQIPLWILGVTHRAKSFMSADLVELARRLGLLSVWEATRFLLALELLHDLRNFLGRAEESYYDREARASIFDLREFPPNRVNDSLARLYLFRRKRFESLDALDTIRLRLVADVTRISGALLEKILDQTTTHTIGRIRVSVHLGHKKITSIGSGKATAAGRLARQFASRSALLRLFGFIANTGYDLSDELKEALAEVVALPRHSAKSAQRGGEAKGFDEIMGGRFADRALATMFEINDPLSRRMGTLLGRFIPEYDKVVYLVRDAKSLTVPVHSQLLASVANGQKSLDWLNENYHELHALLAPGHVLALKWSLFLHGLGKIESSRADPSHSAELAVEVLSRLGYRDEDLEGKVRLLIQHHSTMVGLSRTAAYFDQALVQYFEAAGREMVNVILIFLVNRAILMASGFRWGEVENLNRFFEETSKILAASRGVPDASTSLAVINSYLYEKKEELKADTKLYQVLHRSFAVGMDEAVFRPLAKINREEWQRLKPDSERLEDLHRGLVLGQGDSAEQERLVGGLAQRLRNAVSRESIDRLANTDNRVFTWFFCAFPNRYLLSSTPYRLAAQIGKFDDFGSAPVLVDVVGGSERDGAGLLIFTRDLARSHSRVAYMLSRKRINIISGKVNRVELGEAQHGYCYYFQISPVAEDTQLFPRELEGMILNESPPNLGKSPPAGTHSTHGNRVEFLGDDGKGYHIRPGDGEFIRDDAPYRVIRVVLRDEPFLFYKVARIFDQYNVEIQQSLITTTGNQVVDYFYVGGEDYDRLRASSFQERFADLTRVRLV